MSVFPTDVVPNTVIPNHKSVRGLTVKRHFTPPETQPEAGIEWDLRSAKITDEKGNVIFEQKNIEVPKFWSALATNVVASKYFRGPMDETRERSAKQLIGRVVDTITRWGIEGGYFADEDSAVNFRAELAYLCYYQHMAFNSPVWFNVGIEAKPQCSACFINSVEDSMGSILDLAKTEGMLFKYGSGTGSNLSSLRSSKEKLAGGGDASGPVSFMKGFDAFAGVIKSGGKTRRAAKMVILNADHPDVDEFIWCKVREEKKAHVLIDAGYDGSFNGEAYGSVFFQNSNNSVRVNDEFMRAVENDLDWDLKAVRDGRVIETVKARKLFRDIAEAAHFCGDPGLQFDTVINKWHTSKATARINASNPCSEYMYLDDSACNLASLNLLHFLRDDGTFDVESFKHAVEITILAQEILVDNASYPTPKIAVNSRDYRPLGLGYANLGALLMAKGLAYDSDDGRQTAAAITAIMCGHAYATSAKIAQQHGGPFAGYPPNRESFLDVMRMHRAAANELRDPELADAAKNCWDDAVAIGTVHGYRNGQVTVLAPTGTIAFMMDCDTTGIEPDIALVKYKKLVGGGMLKIVNNTVPSALKTLGYGEAVIADIVAFIDKNDTIEGAPHLKPAHLPVFDCAFKARNGTRSIHWMGHIKMMAACQPFLSGAISKTVNLPNDATVEDIERAYLESWKQGLKAVAVYRDGCKRSQPLNTTKDAVASTVTTVERVVEKIVEVPVRSRRKLPDERHAITHKFAIGEHEGYLTVGLYDDGTPGELFITMSKEGSTISGLMDSFATSVSLALQYGVPLAALVNKFAHVRFEPSGWTGNDLVPQAKSIVDYIFRWMEAKFLNNVEISEPAPAVPQLLVEAAPRQVVQNGRNGTFANQADAPPCSTCGEITVRNGACYKCMNCGSTTGCS